MPCARSTRIKPASSLRKKPGAALLLGARESAAPLQIQLDVLGKRLALIASTAIAVILARGFLRGEPDQLIGRAAREKVPAPTQGYPPRREEHGRGRERHFDDERYRRRRKSLLGEIYDFD